ncbi:MAG: putative membrane protein (Fun14 family) [Planctomycetota bacterium]|jgi:uncharacterized membrane protein (Fun14 family)
MSDHEVEAEESVEASKLALAGWQKALLLMAVAFIGVGFALGSVAEEPADSQADVASMSMPAGGEDMLKSSSLVSSGGTWGGESEDASAPEPEEESVTSASTWSPFFVKGGFSFFLAFCMGYALRTFFKISAIFIGLLGLALFGLAKLGVIEPDWTAMEGWFDTLMAHAKADFVSFKEFIAGSLPSAGFATLGLFTGFKKG